MVAFLFKIGAVFLFFAQWFFTKEHDINTAMRFNAIGMIWLIAWLDQRIN